MRATTWTALACCAVVAIGFHGACSSGTGSGGGGGGGDRDQQAGGEGLTLTLTVSPAGGSGTGPDQAGRIVVEPEKESYEAGETVKLTAEPEPGYRFDHWAGDASGNNNPFVIGITTDLSVEAVFVTDPDAEGSARGGPITRRLGRSTLRRGPAGRAMAGGCRMS